MQCQQCAGEQFVKAGRDRVGRQMYQCAACNRRQTNRSASAFRGYRFPDDLIALAVRWYLRFRLPYADIAELLAERGVHVDPSSVYEWVQQFTLLYKDAARSHRHRVGTRWAVDETSIRMAGRWVYAYRAIDEHGQVIDVYLSETRETAAATAFFEQAIARTDVRPRLVTTDKAPTYPPALRAVVPEAEHVTGKMEQQGIARDHQHLKGRTRCMRGFQQRGCVAADRRAGRGVASRPGGPAAGVNAGELRRLAGDGTRHRADGRTAARRRAGVVPARVVRAQAARSGHGRAWAAGIRGHARRVCRRTRRCPRRR